MHSPNLPATIVNILFGLILALFGIIGLLWPWLTRFRIQLLGWLDSGTVVIPLVGLGLLLLGIVMIAGVVVSSRRSYYHVRMGDRTVKVDEEVIQGYLAEYWATLFPEHEVGNRIRIRRQKIYVTSSLPYVPFGQQRDLLQRIDTDLSEIFSRVLDYRKEFYFTASFDKQKTEKE